MKFNKRILNMLLLLVVVLYCSWTIIDQQFALSKNSGRVQAQMAQIEELNQKTAQLDKEKERINTPEYKEHIARLAGLAKKNEMVFVDTLTN